MSGKAWTIARQIKGNLFPALVGAPFEIFGILWMRKNQSLLGLGFWLFVAGVILSAISLNWLGLYDNPKIQSEFDAANADYLSKVTGDRVFCGFAPPKYKSLLDPHADVGYLITRPDDFEFYGETYRLKFSYMDFTTVRKKPNIHSFLGLGGWICLEGPAQKGRLRLLLEPRPHRSMLANKRAARRLVAQFRSKVVLVLKDPAIKRKSPPRP